MTIYILLTAAFCIFIMIVVIRSYRKKMLKFYDSLLQKLDAAISGKTQDTVYDESLDAAITERLNRIVQITKSQKGKAEEERDIIKSLISDISHQVRTPLSNIVLYTGLLKEEELDDAVLALADKIENNAEKLDFFMKELIKSSYTEQEIISVKPQKVSVEELISRACQTAELAALKKNIAICREHTDCSCYADAKWTIEVIGNVIENAIKYSHEHSRILIEVIPYESFICIKVKDTGIGIAEEEQGAVFQRFYRGTNAKNSPGFGIGLYLAREVLSRQGGYMKVDSELNRGTTVHIFLSRRPI